jgi:hypothetical protein
MKTWLKHGFGLLAGLVFAGGVLADDSVPIEDLDTFEKEYIGCVMTGLKDHCFSNLVSKHISPAIENVGQVISMLRKNDDTFVKNNLSVYKVHIVDRIKRGNIVESRTYMIERSNGLFVGSYVNFIQIKDKWYISAFGIDNADDLIKSILNLPVNQ